MATITPSCSRPGRKPCRAMPTCARPPTDAAALPSFDSIHPSAWNSNSTKFAVASDSSGATDSTRQQHGGTPSASKRSDLVAVVARLCIKWLRLVTVQLPENFSLIGQGPTELHVDGVLRSSHSPGPVPGVCLAHRTGAERARQGSKISPAHRSDSSRIHRRSLR
jgi:hypothetical protein